MIAPDVECHINDVLVNDVGHGVGAPFVALYRTGVDHREIETTIEAIVPGTGIPVNLPGMGLSRTDGLNCNDDLVTLHGEFIDHLGAGTAMLRGHSATRHGAGSGIGVPRRGSVTNSARPSRGSPSVRAQVTGASDIAAIRYWR